MLVELILVPIMSGGGVDLGSLSVLKIFRIARVFRMARIVRSVSRRMLLTRGVGVYVLCMGKDILL